MDEYERVRQGKAGGSSSEVTIPITGENLLQKIARQCIADSDRYFPQYHSASGPMGRLLHFAIGMSTEAGEFLEICKKVDRGQYDFDTEAIKAALEKEAVDTFIYLMNAFGEMGIDPFAAYIKKREYNNTRKVNSRGEWK